MPGTPLKCSRAWLTVVGWQFGKNRMSGKTKFKLKDGRTPCAARLSEKGFQGNESTAMRPRNTPQLGRSRVDCRQAGRRPVAAGTTSNKSWMEKPKTAGRKSVKTQSKAVNQSRTTEGRNQKAWNRKRRLPRRCARLVCEIAPNRTQ